MNYGFAIKSGDGNNENDHAGTVQLLADVLGDGLPKIQASGLTFYGVKLIYACLRFITKEHMKWCMHTCIELKQKFPDLICGFDLQGQEDAGQPLAYWIPELLDMRARDHGGDTDINLFDAILLGTKRIGHGFSIIKYPLLMQLCKEKKIAIETCPISNEVLGLCPTTKAHDLPILLSNCVPCTINSDDPGSWGASVLYHDFYQALMGSNNLSIPGLRVIADWSIEQSCMSSDMQEKVYRDFEGKWFVFC
ncbi:uncharacterized protein FRV6_04777 [Fusarium oxysporum]|uniref:Adenosine deaminase domain-containing protein n=1 Tax=Fusarium oxysporum TaxID=5507 RepID=A0A2H3T793_FUSOX|nr:uncharacterized protein FRV6_04777 [Fusarium oxysporum]